MGDSYLTFSTQRPQWGRSNMLLTQNMSCLLLIAAWCVQADPYRGSEKIGSLGEFDVRANWGSNEFEITSMENFDSTHTTSVENFGTPKTPTEGNTKRRTVGSWSSWSRLPNVNFPKRNCKE